MTDLSPNPDNLRPHPLAAALAERLRPQPRARVLEIGTGSGRNRAALAAAGFEVCSANADSELPLDAFDGALTTHALLHGTRESIAASLARIAAALRSGAPFYATFGAKRDARYGKGNRIAPDTFSPETGDEAGVAHTYFDEAGLRALLEPYYVVESMEEAEVDEIVGRWAHADPPRGSVHLFVVARVRRTS